MAHNRRQQSKHDHAAFIRRKHRNVLVAVDHVSSGPAPIVDVATMDALVKLARKYESLIMDLPEGEGASFLLWDNGLLYRYRTGVVAAPTTPGS